MSNVKTQLIIEGKNNSKKAFEEVNSQLETMSKRMAANGKALYCSGLLIPDTHLGRECSP